MMYMQEGRYAVIEKFVSGINHVDTCLCLCDMTLLYYLDSSYLYIHCIFSSGFKHNLLFVMKLLLHSVYIFCYIYGNIYYIWKRLLYMETSTIMEMSTIYGNVYYIWKRLLYTWKRLLYGNVCYMEMSTIWKCLLYGNVYNICGE